jgi:hypothetical protein
MQKVQGSSSFIRSKKPCQNETNDRARWRRWREQRGLGPPIMTDVLRNPEVKPAALSGLLSTLSQLTASSLPLG